MRCEGIVAQLYLDPRSRPARRLTSAMAPRTVKGIPAAPLAGIRGPLRRCWQEAGGGNQWERAFDEALEALTPPGEAGGSLDDRVAEVLELLHAAPGQSIPLSMLAQRVALSPGRLGHLFSSHVGLPMRRYVLWLRLIDAIHRMARGAALTEAAHGADFSDSAHLSRTFRRMFGMAPSSLVEVAMFVRAHPVTSLLVEASRWPG
jgi:AraC-like DNA-binding protein